jgi:hypothetical protein
MVTGPKDSIGPFPVTTTGCDPVFVTVKVKSYIKSISMHSVVSIGLSGWHTSPFASVQTSSV